MTQRVKIATALGLAVSLGVMTVILATGPVSASSNSCTNGGGTRINSSSICKGLSFYSGKAITLIAPTTAGSGTDITARAEAKEMGLYLGATVNVLDISAGADVLGQDDVAAAKPDGLTIGILDLSEAFYDQISGIKTLGFDPKRLAFLGTIPAVGNLLATQASSPYTSFASLFHTSASAPVKVLTTEGASASEALLFFAAFGVHTQFLTGYSGSTAVAVGFLRGDGPLVNVSISALISEISNGGLVRVLALDLLTNKIPRDIADYSVLQTVPTVPQLLKKYPPKTADEKKAATYYAAVTSVPDSVLGAPSSTPTDRVNALVASFKFAARSTYVKTVQLTKGSITGYIRGSTIKAAYVNSLRAAPKIAAFLKSLGST